MSTELANSKQEPFKMTLVDLVLYLHEHLLEYLGPEEGQENMQQLGWLSGTLSALMSAADDYGDVKLSDVLDDMHYIAAETCMGARWKGEGCLSSLQEKIDALKWDG